MEEIQPGSINKFKYEITLPFTIKQDNDYDPNLNKVVFNANDPIFTMTKPM